MNINDVIKSQQRIIDKIPKFHGINSTWLEKLNRIELSVSKSTEMLKFNNSAILDSYFKTFNKIDETTSFIDATNILDKIKLSLSFLDYDFSTLTKNEIEDNEFEEEKRSIIITETSRIKDVIIQIYNNNQKLFSLHPREFEKIIAELLYYQGFDIELTKQTRDNGYDILALKYVDGLSPVKYLVECKRYAENRKVGVEIVRSFKEVLQTENANKGIIVTTSYFSKDAIQKQKETPYLLDYKNKDEVIEWVNDYFFKPTANSGLAQ